MFSYIKRLFSTKQKPFPIIILEGCDASGKTTLAKQLANSFGNSVYIHNAIAPDIKKLHWNTWKAAKELSKTHTVIIDRLWLSEYVYGSIYRNGPSYDLQPLIKDILSTPKVYQILCETDKKTTLSLHKQRSSKEMFKKIDKVWDLYHKTAFRKYFEIYNWKKNIINLDFIKKEK